MKTVWIRSSGKDIERLTCMLLGSSFGEKHEHFLVVKVRPSTRASVQFENEREQHGFGKIV